MPINLAGVKRDVDAIIQQAEIIWPPRTSTRDGFEHVEESREVKTIRKYRKQIPTDTKDWRGGFAWRDSFLDELKALGQLTLAAHNHPSEWKKILNRVKAIRDQFPGRRPA